MVNLLAIEAKNSGSELSDEDRQILSEECLIPESLRDKAKDIIRHILEREQLSGETDVFEHPDSFGNSMEWAGDPQYPNLVRLTEEVILEGRAAGIFPEAGELHGWGLVKDKLLLVACGLLIVITVLVAGGLFFSK